MTKRCLSIPLDLLSDDALNDLAQAALDHRDARHIDELLHVFNVACRELEIRMTRKARVA